MIVEQDVDIALRRMLREPAPTPDDGLARALAQAAGTPQQAQGRGPWGAGAWAGSIRPLRTRVGRPQPTAYVMALVLLAALFMLGAATLLLSVGQQAPARTVGPSPTDQSRALLPMELPRGVASGSVDTPLGAARWVHVQGGGSALPGASAIVVPGPDGLVALDPAIARLWDSPDGISWTSRSLPAAARDAHDLARVEGTYWLRSPHGIWRSDDASTWEPVDVSSILASSRGPTDRDRGFAPGAPITVHGLTLVPVAYGAADGGIEQGVGVIDGDVARAAVLPGRPRPDRSVALLETRDGPRAFLPDGDGGLLVWRSGDGRTWEAAEPVRLGTPVHSARTLQAYGGSVGAWVRADGDDGSWASIDGDTWDPVTSGLGLRLGSGGADFDFGSSRLSITAPDGASSDVGIVGLSVRPNDDLRTANAVTVGRALLVWWEPWDAPSDRHLWIVEVEAPG